MTGHPIPESPEQITDLWLTSVLRGSGAVDRASVTAHRSELAESQGAAAVVARLELDYDLAEEGAPRTLVAKLAPTHEPIRALMHGLGGYEREVEFYRQFGADPGIPTPRRYRADIDPASGLFVLLLEDMSDSRVGDPGMPSVEEVEAVVRHLAPFHAKWWNHPRLRELAFLRYPGSPADGAFMAQARAALTAALPAARERFSSELPQTLVTLAERLLGNFDALLQMRLQRFQGMATLVHGDCHPGQIFFPAERGGRFAVFDWQTVSAGSGADDLARIIVTGMSGEEQEASGPRLFDLYHALLVEHGVTGYDVEQRWDAYRLGVLTSAVMNIIAAVNIDPAQIEEVQETLDVSMTEVFFGWVAAAVEAHDVLALLET